MSCPELAPGMSSIGIVKCSSNGMGNSIASQNLVVLASENVVKLGWIECTLRRVVNR
jgi:hypothetical protein